MRMAAAAQRHRRRPSRQNLKRWPSCHIQKASPLAVSDVPHARQHPGRSTHASFATPIGVTPTNPLNPSSSILEIAPEAAPLAHGARYPAVAAALCTPAHWHRISPIHSHVDTSGTAEKRCSVHTSSDTKRQTHRFKLMTVKVQGAGGAMQQAARMLRASVPNPPEGL